MPPAPTGRVSQLIEKCRLFLHYRTLTEAHNETRYVRFVFDQVSRFPEDKRREIKVPDHFVKERPNEAAQRFIEQLSPAPSPEEIQGFLNNLSAFKESPGEMFEKVGFFVSAMINLALAEHPELEFTLPDNTLVHRREHYIYSPESISEQELGYPWRMENLFEHYRTQLLLSYLASCISRGKVTFNGNVGAFFGNGSTGGQIILNGESGWKPFYGLKGAV